MQRTLLAATLVATSFVSSASFAVDLVASPEVPQYHGTTVRDFRTNQVVRNTLPSAETLTVVYDNLTSPAAPTAGFASLNTANAIYGDDVILLNGGELHELFFSIFNPSASAGPMTGGSIEINFYDGNDLGAGLPSTLTPVGSFTGTLDFSADPLPPGFFTTTGFVGLESLDIILPDYVLITQKFTPTGTATQNGFVSFNPINVGSSFNDFYMNRVGNPEGYYTLNPSGSLTNLGYFVVVPEPTTLAGLAAASLVALRRRRA